MISALLVLGLGYSCTVLELKEAPTNAVLDEKGEVYYQLAGGWFRYAAGKQEPIAPNVILASDGSLYSFEKSGKAFAIRKVGDSASAPIGVYPKFVVKGGQSVLGLLGSPNTRAAQSIGGIGKDLPLAGEWTPTPAARDSDICDANDSYAVGWFRWKKEKGEYYLPARWKDLAFESLEVPNGFNHGRANKVNANGFVVGAVSSDPPNAGYLWNSNPNSSPRWQAATWQDGKCKLLLPFYWGDVELPRNINDSTEALDVNDAGVVVGVSMWVSSIFAPEGRKDIPFPRATIWRNGRPEDMSRGGPPGYHMSRPVAINNRGQILCWGGGPKGRQLVLMTP